MSVIYSTREDPVLTGGQSALYESSKNLKQLYMRGWQANRLKWDNDRDFSQWQDLELLHMEGTCVHRLTRFPPHLRSLNIGRNYSLRSISAAGRALVVADNLKELETFDCAGSGFVDAEVLDCFLAPSISSGTLRTVRIGDRSTPAKPSCEMYVDAPTVTMLSLAGLPWQEKYLQAMCQKHPNLKRLDLSKTPVTGVLVKELCTREVGPLEWLCLVDCNRVGSDAIEFARSLGTQVEYCARVNGKIVPGRR